MSLTNDQQKAHDYVLDWISSTKKKSLLTMGGLAGTGKTYTIGQICKTIKESMGMNIAFATMTGKAQVVLRSKVEDFMTPGDFVGTIYGLIYSLVGEDKKKRELYFERVEKDLHHGLIIIDEASMVNQAVMADLSSYGVPILAVGDHGKLPPVKDIFNLMSDPEIKLETIVRQAEGNPIIKMARMAREYGNIDFGDYGQGCIKTRNTSVLHDHKYDDLNSIMLCALNTTRTRMNNFARESMGIKGDLPEEGEPLICLLNNRRKFIFNGHIGTLQELNLVDDITARIEVDLGDRSYNGLVDIPQFGKKYLNKRDEMDVDYFDWAYCITVWKSQGSEWNNVLLLEEYIPKFTEDMKRRFLYTACTRAREKLVIFKR